MQVCFSPEKPLVDPRLGIDHSFSLESPEWESRRTNSPDELASLPVFRNVGLAGTPIEGGLN